MAQLLEMLNQGFQKVLAAASNVISMARSPAVSVYAVVLAALVLAGYVLSKAGGILSVPAMVYAGWTVAVGSLALLGYWAYGRLATWIEEIKNKLLGYFLGNPVVGAAGVTGEIGGLLGAHED